MENRKRSISKKFWVTEEENEFIEQKMEQAHTKQFGAYARKMLIDGLIVHVDSLVLAYPFSSVTEKEPADFK